MKKYVYLLIALVFNMACEDVIEVDLPDEETRLIVDALIRVDETQPFLPIEVKLSLSSNFFEENVPTSAESVVISYSETIDDIVVETRSSSLAETSPGSGIYVPDPNFSSDQRIPSAVLSRNFVYELYVRHQNRLYIASTKYVPTTPINRISQGTTTLFDEDETEVVVNFTDDPERNDFYLFDFGFGEYLVTEDEFYQGQEFEFSYFYDQQFFPGTIIEISIMGTDQSFYNYMDQLIEQSGDTQGPFQIPVSTVRGNVFDITDLDNIDVIDNVDQPNVFPLGYFAIVQEFTSNIVIGE